LIENKGANGTRYDAHSILTAIYITSGGISIGTNGACNNNASWKFEDALDAPFIKMDRDLEFALAALQQQRLLEV
jgi:hypothetical protein